jgi:hypothetical protein
MCVHCRALRCVLLNTDASVPVNAIQTAVERTHEIRQDIAAAIADY